MKQHAVPENIMDVEFKLFGSLTAKQFGYIIAGGLMGVFMYYIFGGLGSDLLAFVFAGLSAALGISLALVKINEQPFEVWLGNFLAAMFTSQKRVWRKEKKVPESLAKNTKKSATMDTKTATPVQPTPEPVASHPVDLAQSSEPVAEQTTLPKHPFKALDNQQIDQQSQGSPDPIGSNPQLNQIANPAGGGQTFPVPGSAQGSVSVTNNQDPRPLSTPALAQNTVSGAILHKPQAPFTTPQGGQQSDDVVPTTSEPEPPKDVKYQQPETVDSQAQSSASAPAPTPTPVEPISSAQSPVAQFDDIVPSAPAPSTQDSGSDPVAPVQPQQDDELSEENKALRERIVEYTEDKKKLEDELATTKQGYDDLREQNQKILNQLESLGKELSSLKQQPQPKQGLPPIPQTAQPQPVVQPTPQEEKVSETGLFTPKVYSGPSLSKKPNVISGIVKTKEGKLLPGVVVIVKDPGKAHPRPIRAMKTNSLGQFITTSAIEENGTYVIELSKSGYSFGRYEIELKSEVLPTYEFIAD